MSCGLAFLPHAPSHAVPGFCPPICDGIPDAAWVAPTSIPLYPVYRWPRLAGLAVTAPTPRFAFESLCDSAPVRADPRTYAVAATAAVVNPDGQWQLQAQVIHWRGDAATGGQIAISTVDQARSLLRSCQVTTPQASASLTTNDPAAVAAVISVAGRRVMHQYLLAHPQSSTVVELALWSTVPPLTPWPGPPDAVVLEALRAPLCSAYLGSCR
jgi:hypothetical protein